MNPLTPHDSTTLVLRHTFMAPRERVFRAWLSPVALEAWLRPRGMRMTVSEFDARVGGSFRFDLANGTSIVGTYLEIVPNEKLIFTWSGAGMQDRETTVTVDFLGRGPLTEIVLTHEGLRAPEQRALVEGGWPTLLDALASALVSSDLAF
jgi:uncharacterized protein YndB with AHSA1/START domain